MIVFAEYVRADALDGTGLFHHLCQDDVVGAALSCIVDHDTRLPPASILLRHREIAPGAPEILATWRERLRAMPHADAVMHHCIDAVEYAVRAQSFDAGLAASKRLHDQLAGLPMNGGVALKGATS